MYRIKTPLEGSAARSWQLTLASSIPYMPRVQVRWSLWTAVAIPVGFGLGLAVASGHALLITTGVVILAALAAVVLRPELILLVWFAAILANGRWLTYHEIGPLYVTEPLLVLLTLGVVVRLLLGVNERSDSTSRNRVLRFLTLLAIVVFVPGMAAVLVYTSDFDYRTVRNVALIAYVLFAFIAAWVTDLGRSYRHWFLVGLVGPTIALLLVITGQAGPPGVTSTGAIRIAAHTFPLAFGIAPLVLAAAARERLIRPFLALAGAIPFLIGLLFVNHRSAWVALIAAAAVLFGRRLSGPIIVGGAAIVASGFLLFTGTVSHPAIFGEELERARTVTSTSDPNARYRLSFWKNVLTKSIESPLIGAGFEPYATSVLPPANISSYDNPDNLFPEPHNSFIAIAYRIGLIPLVLLLVLLAHIIWRGYRASVERDDPRSRATCSALTSIVVYVGVASAFNVYLEAPYAGPLFWTAVGLLAYAVFTDPFGALTRRGEGVGLLRT